MCNCVVVYWLLQKRHLLEDSNQLDARRSALDDDLEEMEEDEEEGEFKVGCGLSTSLAIFSIFLPFLVCHSYCSTLWTKQCGRVFPS